MDPTKFQELAVQLKSFQTPCHNRAAIGRSYYAAFHVAASLLRANGFPIKNNHTAHDEVYRHLSWSDDEEVARAGSQLNDMRGFEIRRTISLRILKPRPTLAPPSGFRSAHIASKG